MEQPPRPAYHQHRADDAHERIKPYLPHILARQKGEDRQHRGQCVRRYMEIGGPEIVVLLVGGRSGMSVVLLVVTTTEIMGMRVLVAVMVAPVILLAALRVGVAVPTEDQQAYAVDDQSENRNENSLVEPMATGDMNRAMLSHAMTRAKRTSITALANPASELTLPVPKLNRASLAWRRV